MTYAIGHRTETVVGSREEWGYLRQAIASGQSNNVNSYSLNFPSAPDGSLPLFLAFGVEDATTTISSITTTGTTWSRVYRSTVHGDGLELWAAPPGASSNNVAISMSATQFSHAVALEIGNVSPRIVGQTTVALSSSPLVIDTPIGNDVCIVNYRRAGAGGTGAAAVAVGLPMTRVQLLAGNNAGVWFFSPRPPQVSVTGTTTTDSGVSIATLDRA